VRNQKIDKQVEDDSWSDVWMQLGWMKLYTSLAFLTENDKLHCTSPKTFVQPQLRVGQNWPSLQSFERNKN